MAERPGEPGTFLLAALGVSLALILIFGAIGLWWAELVLVPVAFFIAYVWWEPIVDRLADPAERVAHRAADQLWALARLGRVALSAWSRRSRTEVRVWAGQVQLRKQHDRALRSLGQATYSGDEGQAARARAWADQTARRLADYERQRASSRAETEERMERERTATQPTEQFPTATEQFPAADAPRSRVGR